MNEKSKKKIFLVLFFLALIFSAIKLAMDYKYINLVSPALIVVNSLILFELVKRNDEIKKSKMFIAWFVYLFIFSITNMLEN